MSKSIASKGEEREENEKKEGKSKPLTEPRDDYAGGEEVADVSENTQILGGHDVLAHTASCQSEGDGRDDVEQNYNTRHREQGENKCRKDCHHCLCCCNAYHC